MLGFGDALWVHRGLLTVLILGLRRRHSVEFLRGVSQVEVGATESLLLENAALLGDIDALSGVMLNV